MPAAADAMVAADATVAADAEVAITAAAATVAVVASVAVAAVASALGWAAAAGGGGVVAAAEATGAGVTTVGTGAVGRTELRFRRTKLSSRQGCHLRDLLGVERLRPRASRPKPSPAKMKALVRRTRLRPRRFPFATTRRTSMGTTWSRTRPRLPTRRSRSLTRSNSLIKELS